MTPEKIRWGLSNQVRVCNTPDQEIFEFFLHYRDKPGGPSLGHFLENDDETLMALWAQFLFERET